MKYLCRGPELIMLGPKILGWGPDLLCRVADFEYRGPNSFAGSVVGAPR